MVALDRERHGGAATDQHGPGAQHTAKLTLPALHLAPLQVVHGVDQLGQLLPQQTGVSKVTLETEQNGDTKLIGEIGVTVTLGTAVVPAAKSLVEPSPSKIYAEGALAQDIAKATTGQVLVNNGNDTKKSVDQEFGATDGTQQVEVIR